MLHMPDIVYARMNKDERKWLIHLQRNFKELEIQVVDWNEDEDHQGLLLDHLKVKRTAYEEMLYVYAREMIEKYELKPLVSEHLTPKPTLNDHRRAQGFTEPPKNPKRVKDWWRLGYKKFQQKYGTKK